MFWKVVPSGRSGNRPAARITSKCHDGVQRKVPGSLVHLPYAVVGASMVGFAEPSCPADSRQELAVSLIHLCRPFLGFPWAGGPADRAGPGWVHCMCPPRTCLPVWQGSPLTSPQSSEQPVFPQMGLCVYQHELGPCAHLPPTVPSAPGRHPGDGSGPRGTACISLLLVLINQVAWESSVFPPHSSPTRGLAVF